MWWLLTPSYSLIKGFAGLHDKVQSSNFEHLPSVHRDVLAAQNNALLGHGLKRTVVVAFSYA